MDIKRNLISSPLSQTCALANYSYSNLQGKGFLNEGWKSCWSGGGDTEVIHKSWVNLWRLSWWTKVI